MALVLVIDDDWSYRSILRRILESRGHDVAEASSSCSPASRSRNPRCQALPAACRAMHDTWIWCMA